MLSRVRYDHLRASARRIVYGLVVFNCNHPFFYNPDFAFILLQELEMRLQYEVERENYEVCVQCRDAISEVEQLLDFLIDHEVLPDSDIHSIFTEN